MGILRRTFIKITAATPLASYLAKGANAPDPLDDVTCVTTTWSRDPKTRSLIMSPSSATLRLRDGDSISMTGDEMSLIDKDYVNANKMTETCGERVYRRKTQAK